MFKSWPPFLMSCNLQRYQNTQSLLSLAWSACFFARVVAQILNTFGSNPFFLLNHSLKKMYNTRCKASPKEIVCNLKKHGECDDANLFKVCHVGSLRCDADAGRKSHHDGVASSDIILMMSQSDVTEARALGHPYFSPLSPVSPSSTHLSPSPVVHHNFSSQQ